jgi:hypothetical protein
MLRVFKHALLIPAGAGFTAGDAKLQWSALWTGSVHHLWFLPFLLATTLFVLLVIRAVEATPLLRLPLGVVLAALGFEACQLSMPAALRARPDLYLLERSFLMLPAVCWGTAFGLILMGRAHRFENHRAVGWVGLSVAVIGTVTLWRLDADGAAYRLARHACGMGWLLMGLAPAPRSLVRHRLWGHVTTVGRGSYWIFLSHVAFIEAALAAASCVGLKTSWRLDIWMFAFTCTIATALSAPVGRCKWARWLGG